MDPVDQSGKNTLDSSCEPSNELLDIGSSDSETVDANGMQKLSLLYVEDSAEGHATIRDSLLNFPDYSFSFEFATSLKQAQSILEKTAFDAILLNMHLPDSVGLGTLKSISPFTPTTPIILLLNEQSDHLIHQTIELGADNHIFKSDFEFGQAGIRVVMTIRRKKMERELVASKERFELAVRGSSVGLWDLNVVTEELFWSDRLREILGVTDKNFVPNLTSFSSRLHPEDKDWVLKDLESHLESHSAYDLEYRLRHEGGHYIWAHARGEALWDEDSNPIRMAGSVEDITDRKNAEKEKQDLELQLRHTQKLESVGQLAAGIAHEINTPIQFIGDNLGFLKETFADLTELIQAYQQAESLLTSTSEQEESRRKLEKTREDIDLEFLLEDIPNAQNQAEDGVKRVSEIVRAMKEFSHPPVDDMAPADINKTLTNTLIVARNEYKYVAEAKTNFGDIPQVPCLIGDINQVFLNLVVNAGHAIDDARENDSDPLGLIEISSAVVGEFVEVRIKDSGCGMSEEVQAKIFDPFFTTKEVGRGTGQGLAIAQNIVHIKHGGELDVESEIGAGTTMIVRLPLTKTEAKSS